MPNRERHVEIDTRPHHIATLQENARALDGHAAKGPFDDALGFMDGDGRAGIGANILQKRILRADAKTKLPITDGTEGGLRASLSLTLRASIIRVKALKKSRFTQPRMLHALTVLEKPRVVLFAAVSDVRLPWAAASCLQPAASPLEAVKAG